MDLFQAAVVKSAGKKAVDSLRDGDDAPNWQPLENALPENEWGGWMWMYRSVQDGTVIEHYKHGISRCYLHVDYAGVCYSYSAARQDAGQNAYKPTSLQGTLAKHYWCLGEMGVSRTQDYDDAYRRARDQALAEKGYATLECGG